MSRPAAAFSPAYSDQGIRTVVVTCTNGEYGDAPGGVKPGQDGHDAQAVAQLRLAELRQAVKILRVSHLETLGYRDSGMEEWDIQGRPGGVLQHPARRGGRPGSPPLSRNTGRRCSITYDDAGAYQHPDHVHASRAAQAAAAATGIPAKVYLSTMRGSSLAQDLGGAARAGRGRTRLRRGPRARPRALESEQRITTTIDIRPVLSRKREALLTHGSQINDSWFSKLPPEVAEEAFGYEYFIRVADTTGAPIPETDLFAGLRSGE